MNIRSYILTRFSLRRFTKGFTRKGSAGFTLIEVLIAVSIFSVALIGLASLATQSMKATETGKRLSQAVNMANLNLEALRAVPYANVQSTGTDGGIGRSCGSAAGTPPVFTCTPSSPTTTFESLVFTWSYTVTYIDLDGDSTYYSTNPVIDSGDIKRIDLTVTWTDLFGGHTYSIAALRSKI
jgi:prepilin-type N-terminal cleavage/methylation domain-containing protein